MKESLWGYLFMMMGILGIFLINLFGQIVVKNEQDYYLLKEVTKAAMIDAVDRTAYRVGIGHDGVKGEYEAFKDSMHCPTGIPGQTRIIKEVFVESFVRRFSEGAFLNRKYKIVFHDIDECPPKVSVSIVSTQDFNYFKMFTSDYNSDASIVNSITAILEEYPIHKK